MTEVSIDESLTDDSAVGQFVRKMLGSVNQSAASLIGIEQ
jgi:hypothetical protein